MPRPNALGPVLIPALAGAAATALAVAACTNAPAARSPLKEELASADNPAVEDAARQCLTKTGWKVDPIGGVSGGATTVTAYKSKTQTEVYIYPPKTAPRITGGPDFDDAFWGCLGRQLGGSGGAGGGAGDKSDPADKDKGGSASPDAG
jgi:hypothetical protein